MNYFEDLLQKFPTLTQEKLREIIEWINNEYPNLEPMIKWNQPMFANNGTYIISFAPYKAHIAIAPEVKTMEQFREKIQAAGYDTTNNTFKILYTQPIDYALMKEIIDFQVEDRAGMTKFWC